MKRRSVGLLLVLAGAVVSGALFLAWRGGRSGSPGPARGVTRAALASSRVTPPIEARPGDLFEDVTARAGIDFVHHVPDGHMDTILEAVGSGAVWLDHDGDGLLDLYLLDYGRCKELASPGGPPPSNRLYRNLGDGRFEEVTGAAGVGDTGFGYAAASADYDNDGDADLYVLNQGPNRLYRNRGDGRFEEVGERAGVASERSSVGGTFLDADGDGLLDLYVANYLRFDPDYRTYYSPDNFPGPLAYAAEADQLFLNNGDGSFRAAGGPGSGLDVVPGRAMGVTPFDYDLDGRTDLYVANDASPNFLFHNLGGGRFEELGVMSGVAYGQSGEATASMAGSVGDFDADGLPDLHVTDGSYGSLYRNLGGGQFADRILESRIGMYSAPFASWGGGFLDFDNDGDLDLFLVNGDLHHATGRPDLLLENTGGGFEDASKRGGAYFELELVGRGGAIADFDNDGQLDILVTNIGDRPVLLRNRGVPGNHWLGLRLRGRRSNRDGFGTRIVVEAAGRRRVEVAQPRAGYLTQGDPRLHFGLGGAARVDRIEALWPSGVRQVVEDVEADRYYELVEGEGLR